MNDFAILCLIAITLFVEVFSVAVMASDNYTFSYSSQENPFVAENASQYDYGGMSNDVPQGTMTSWKAVLYLFTLRSPFDSSGMPSLLGMVISFINYILIIAGVWVGYRLIRSGAG